MQQYNNYHSQNVGLKPKLQAQTSAYQVADDLSDEPIASDEPLVGEHAQLKDSDQRLKQRIRILKFISRVIAFGLSLVTLVPLAMTVAKYLLTKNDYFNVDGTQRTAWPAHPITWYTYMYFSVASITFLFNFAILIAYWRGVKQANSVASAASCWSHMVLVGHVVVWVVSTALYKLSSLPIAGEFRGLWGWTCSPASDALQPQVTNINYGTYCTMQTISFYAGLVNIAANVLSALLLLLAGIRLRSKMRVKNLRKRGQVNLEPLRS